MKLRSGVLSILLLISTCNAIPQNAETPDKGSVADLISQVFGKPPGSEQQPQQQVEPTVSTTSLDDLINAAFSKPSSSGGGGGGAIGDLVPSKLGGEVSGGNCECVPYYQCQNGSILDDGVGLIDISYGSSLADALERSSQ